MLNPEFIPILNTVPTPRKRLFEAGEMKLLVLHFISQQPKYSYDIIKDVSALVGGDYKPSTGTICPTINYLEEQGFTQVEITEDQRKQYHITQVGETHLQEQQDLLQQVLCRFDTRRKIHNDQQYVPIKHAMEQLKAAVKTQILHGGICPQNIQEIAAHIEQAAIAISHLENT